MWGKYGYLWGQDHMQPLRLIGTTSMHVCLYVRTYEWGQDPTRSLFGDERQSHESARLAMRGRETRHDRVTQGV